jgi:hypothetical protein
LRGRSLRCGAALELEQLFQNGERAAHQRFFLAAST